MTYINFTLTPSEADRILDSLCETHGLSREWWSKVAQRFLELYDPELYGEGTPLAPPTPRPAASPTLQSSALAIRDLLDAIQEYLGGRDIFEECSKVSQTFAGDYDCEGCSACGLYYEMLAAEKFIDRIDAHLDEDSRSRQDVPIPKP